MKKYTNCMMNQLALSLTFVEDMLDLQQLVEGVFSL